MAHPIDTSRAMRRPSELRALVQAILQANDLDESDWLEWKSRLDLRAAEGRFHVARAILGFANRLPDRASRNCEGVGYLVVGVEPGTLHGVERVDPAELDDCLVPYMGAANGPAWSAEYVELEGRHVLVMCVEAPRAGDRVRLLRKGLGSAQSGTIFIRRHGKTERATADEVDALQDRASAQAAVRPTLEVGVAGELPLRWLADLREEDPSFEEWLKRECDRMRQAARRWLESEHGDGPLGMPRGQRLTLSAAIAQTSAFGANLTKEDRSLEKFDEQVDAWAEKYRDTALSIALGRSFDGRNAVWLTVRNPSDQNLRGVQVKVHFPGDNVKGFEYQPESPGPPRPPRAFGEPPSSSLAGWNFTMPPMPQVDVGAIGGFSRRTSVEDGSISITFDAGDLRPEETDTSDEIYVMLREYPPDGVLRGTWAATTTATDGILRGALQVPVDSEALTLAELLVDP